MGFFNKILEKLGIGSAAAAPAQTPTAAPAPPRAIAVVDVVAQLEKRAAAFP